MSPFSTPPSESQQPVSSADPVPTQTPDQLPAVSTKETGAPAPSSGTVARFTITAEEALAVPASALQSEKQLRLAPSNEPAFSIRAIVSMVLGILGAPIVGILLGPLAIGLGILALQQINGPEQLRGRGLALSGIALGAVDTVLWIFLAMIYGNHLG